MEYQGWATIYESFREEDDDYQLEQEIERKLSAEVERVRAEIDIGEMGIRGFQHCTRFWCIGYLNRMDTRWGAIVELFHHIAATAPGAYGELSYRDPENADGEDNVLAVYVMKKGKVSKEVNPFMSPCIPELEEVD